MMIAASLLLCLPLQRETPRVGDTSVAAEVHNRVVALRKGFRAKLVNVTFASEERSAFEGSSGTDPQTWPVNARTELVTGASPTSQYDYGFERFVEGRRDASRQISGPDGTFTVVRPDDGQAWQFSQLSSDAAGDGPHLGGPASLLQMSREVLGESPSDLVAAGVRPVEVIGDPDGVVTIRYELDPGLVSLNLRVTYDVPRNGAIRRIEYRSRETDEVTQAFSFEYDRADAIPASMQHTAPQTAGGDRVLADYRRVDFASNNFGSDRFTPSHYGFGSFTDRVEGRKARALWLDFALPAIAVAAIAFAFLRIFRSRAASS